MKAILQYVSFAMMIGGTVVGAVHVFHVIPSMIRLALECSDQNAARRQYSRFLGELPLYFKLAAVCAALGMLGHIALRGW